MWGAAPFDPAGGRVSGGGGVAPRSPRAQPPGLGQVLATGLGHVLALSEADNAQIVRSVRAVGSVPLPRRPALCSPQPVTSAWKIWCIGLSVRVISDH
jgi:hypothetical protein